MSAGHISGVDQRALDWITGWAAIGNEIGSGEGGHLRLVHGVQTGHSEELLRQINQDELLRHGIGRAVLEYFKWEAAQCGCIVCRSDLNGIYPCQAK